MRLTLSWSAFGRNGEILQQERNRGRAPWIFNRTISLLGYCWPKKSLITTTPAPAPLNHRRLGWSRDSGALDQIVLSVMIRGTVFPLPHLPRAWNWWRIAREGHELCLQWVSSRSGPWFDCQLWTRQAIRRSPAEGRGSDREGGSPVQGVFPSRWPPGGVSIQSH